MTELLRWGRTDLLDELPLWRRLGGTSLGLGAVTALGLTASAFLGLGYLKYERLVSGNQVAATHVELANADLQDQLMKLRDRLVTTERSLNTAQGRITSIKDETQKQQANAEQTTASKTDRIGQLLHSLEEAQRDLHLAEAQRVTLLARLSKAEADLTENQQHQLQTQTGIAEWQKKAQQLTIDRDKANAERDQMRLRVEQLEQKLSARQMSRSYAQTQPQPQPAQAPHAQAQQAQAQQAQAQPVQPQPVQPQSTVAYAAPAAPQPATQPLTAEAIAAAAAPPLRAGSVASLSVAIPQPAAVQPVAAPAATRVVAMAATPRLAPAVAVSGGRLAQFERVLGSAGVDVAHLFAQFGVNRGEGGPFIPVARGIPGAESLSAEKIVALSRLVKALPVSAPLNSYEIGSPFGVRGDPINGHAAFHTGLDFRAPYESPVFATAPGVVTFSGYRNDYGKIVEIDHGNGIATRYAHMQRALVSVGQRVTAHMQIGYLGSTGRATGPHVHYEVLVNGEPQDPQKFMSLSHLLPVAQ